MTEKIKQTLRDSKTARWVALGIVSFTMLTGYLFQEIISPLKPMLESQLGWTSSDFGIVTGAYGVFNVVLLMLIVVGVLLDKLGIRFSAITAALIMLVGAAIKFYAIKYGDPDALLNIFGWQVKTQVVIAFAGFGIFGIGVEYAGITVSKIIVKWFKGKEMALAMGLEMASARLGSFGALAFSYMIAKNYSISAPVGIGVLLLIIGLLAFIVYYMMDIKLDKQDYTGEEEEEEPFRLKDIVMIVTNKGFWYIAILCVLFYSAVFPFYKFGPDLMVNKFGIDPSKAGMIPSLLPFGTLFLTPFFGNLYDRKGKGATIMMIGALMLLLVHTVLWIPSLNSVYVAIVMVVILGIAFSLVPSAMWPSVPKIIPEKQLGTAYAMIFWVQNIGLSGVPMLLGFVLDKTNPETVTKIEEARMKFEAMGLDNGAIAEKMDELKAAGEILPWDYETSWLIFIACALSAIVFAFLLKAEDKKKGYGLELPNIEK
ncbi:MFS transporter [Bacteroidota bacterium]